MFKVLLWDIDGTLLDFKKSENYAIKETFRELKICKNITDEMIEEYSVINQKYWLKLEKGEITKKEVQNGRFREFFALKGIDFTDLDGLNKVYQFYLGEKFFFTFGAPEILKEYKGKYRQYVITNGTAHVQTRKLQYSGLDEILDGSFISDEIGYEKPSVKFFDAVFSEIGDVSKDEILIIGDSLTSDIQSANNIGVKCCWYNPYNEKCEKNLRIDYEISSLTQLRDIL